MTVTVVHDDDDREEDERDLGMATPDEVFSATKSLVTPVLRSLATAKRTGGFTPAVVNAALGSAHQQILDRYTDAHDDAGQRQAVINVIDEAIEVAMLDATCDLPGFKTQTLRVASGVVSFGRVLSVATLSANPMPSAEPLGGTSRIGRR